ncbi:MAG: hypothetical protein JNL01_11705 [Bdellovibrionales bacterium]|nr:hypothetical protein [Bdellovibrionales bacterium]
MKNLKVPATFLVRISVAVLVALPQTGLAITRVGNGDDGSDLEGFEALTSGKIVDSRAKAVEYLKSMGTPGIRGLGKLLPEVEKTSLYIAKKDSGKKLEADQGTFHADMRGQVYARTFAESHASTRFFPVAEKLDEDQLIALHIHEGLHRALHPSVRENESVVSEMTLSIVNPDTSYDQIASTANRLLPKAAEFDAAPQILIAAQGMQEAPVAPAPAGSLAAQPSVVSYEHRFYDNSQSGNDRSLVNSMHLIQAHLYPFGNLRDSFGLGLDASIAKQERGSFMGPLGLSARYRLWSGRGFDVAGFGALSLNMLSPDELKMTRFGRDVATLGISMRKDLPNSYVSLDLGYMLPGTSEERISKTTYQYEYGGVVTTSLRVGTRIGKIELGGFADIFLADYVRNKSGSEVYYDTGRFRIMSVGPEITARINEFFVTGYGRFIANVSQTDIDFKDLGNLLSVGSGQSTVGVRVGLRF